MRRCLLILGLLLAAWPALAGPATEAQLRQRYATINNDYFEGKLPTNVVIFYGHPPSGSVAITYTCDGGFCISIDRRFNLAETEAVLTLYHETCHIATWDELDHHGKKWVACMHRLANAGAFDFLW